MYKALVIGCGNIGAGYDIDDDRVVTHAKAYYKNPAFSFSVFDTDITIAKKVKEKYNCGLEESITEKTMEKFDCISICAPTIFHTSYVRMAIQSKVKLVVCEKPVSNKIDELDVLNHLYNSNKTKILVNYVRRFQPKYQVLKQHIATITSSEILTHLSIRYQRGFINNCSHALDLTEYLLGKQIEFDTINRYNTVFDCFQNDPTISLSAKWDTSLVHITGLSNVLFGFFEIDLFFQYSRILIKDAGQTAELYSLKDKKQINTILNLDKTYSDCNKDFMIAVINRAEELLSGRIQQDNFLNSILLNKKMMTYLNKK
jgi:Oxidoreductase family, NAD-binding Rossmann fold